MKPFLALALVLAALVCWACTPAVQTRTNPTDGKVMVQVPAGAFRMGVSEEEGRKIAGEQGALGDLKLEVPEQSVTLPEFWIDRDLVTNAEYKKFTDANPGYPVPNSELDALKPWAWDQGARTFPAHRDNYPVVLVTWSDASAYCKWAGNRLPTEAEWEKAARGSDGRLYPWGNDWDSTKTAFGEKGARDASLVGSFPGGASPWGANDMVGNVWQWTSSLWKAYPYDANDGREDQGQEGARVTRGGMFAFGPAVSRTNSRNALDPGAKAVSVGFRCASN